LETTGRLLRLTGNGKQDDPLAYWIVRFSTGFGTRTAVSALDDEIADSGEATPG
jgi:hypothetical protein